MSYKRVRGSADPVTELAGIAQSVVERALRAGADEVEVVVNDGSELTAKVRLGDPELVQEATSRALGLRVFKDQRRASTYTSDLRPEALHAFILETVTLAELTEPDELNRLPDVAELAADVPELELYDETTTSVDAAMALDRAREAEKAAMAYDDRVTNSDGATYSRNVGTRVFCTSAGFTGGYRGSFSSLYTEPVCDDQGGKKRRGMWWTAARFVDALEAPEAVGVEAARRAIAQIGARKIDSCEVPVVFDPDAGRSIAGMIVQCANGSAFYRKASYMLERENEPVASELVHLVDDPLIRRGPGSRPFDGDGLPTRKNTIVDHGVLRTVLCDVYSARKLGRQSTGSAGRGIGGNPAPTTSNLILAPGTATRAEILADTGTGLYVTSMMGFGFSPITGDFSRGASGFWIENGELAYPVAEVTISANFDDLLKRIDLIGCDVDRRSSTQVPTFRVSRMTIAGS